jgi:hypothetical protein
VRVLLRSYLIHPIKTIVSGFNHEIYTNCRDPEEKMGVEDRLAGLVKQQLLEEAKVTPRQDCHLINMFPTYSASPVMVQNYNLSILYTAFS